MKRKKLLEQLEQYGWKKVREGGNHTIYGKGARRIAIPRHADIHEQLARHIIRQATE